MAVVLGTIRRSGTSFSRGTTIDPYLSAAEVAVLYNGWSDKWPERLFFGGGESAITCEMILEAPESELVTVYGRKMASRLISISKSNV